MNLFITFNLSLTQQHNKSEVRITKSKQKQINEVLSKRNGVKF